MSQVQLQNLCIYLANSGLIQKSKHSKIKIKKLAKPLFMDLSTTSLHIITDTQILVLFQNI